MLVYIRMKTRGFKLHYWGIRGRAQPSVLLALYGDVPLEWDKNVDWPGVLKEQTPFGQLPFLEDGHVKLGQSNAIARYIARKAKLEGSTDAEFAASEQLYEEAGDIYTILSKANYESDKNAAFDKTFAETLPPHFHNLEKLIGEDGHFTKGHKLLAGEIVLFSVLNYAVGLSKDALDKTPKLKKFYETTLAEPKFHEYFAQNLSAYLKRD